MKGSMKFVGKVIKILPDEFVFTGGVSGIDETFEAIRDLIEMKELPITQNIRAMTGMGKSSTLEHLTRMLKDGKIKKKNAKIRFETSTAICFVFEIPNFKKNKVKKKT